MKFITRRECPACGDAKTVTRFRSPFNEGSVAKFIRDYYRIDPSTLTGEYHLKQCESCGVIFQADVGDGELLTALYEEWVPTSPADHPDHTGPLRYPAASRDGHEIIVASAFLGIPLKEMTTLDYGMGWATWARIAALLGCRSYGSDLAPSLMEHARTTGVNAVTDEELKSLKFDFVNTEQVLEHVTDPAGVVGLLAGTLTPGGVLKVSVPSNRGVNLAISKLKRGMPVTSDEMMPVHPLEHVNTFTHEGIIKLGRRFGLIPAKPKKRYAFLQHRGALNLRDPKGLVKELVRPWYQFHSRRNIYLWLQRV